MKQSDIINSVANRILRDKLPFNGMNVLFQIEKEYKYRGKTLRRDPSRMIDKIIKIVEKNYTGIKRP